jgi:ribosome-binding protein aMBF1 (putative translation factor)|uniref:HTH cro/C1-type domain-containing protein n=1 Tax=viral metagenome TaxID=1070528 RepID=A0A6C0LVE0_9ZZZZ
MNNCYQDWEPVVIRSTNAVKSKNKELQQTVEKPMGNKEFLRLNNEELPALNKITHAQAQAISIARNASKLKQKELAARLGIPEKIIRDYENCSVINFSPVLYKRILKNLNVDPKLYI